MYFDILQFNLDILNYNITYIDIYNIYNLKFFKNSYKLKIYDCSNILKKDMLPNSLIDLSFYDNYNQKIEHNILPQSLTHLTFGYGFNQKIEPLLILL
jgi:hypothetical protein